MQGTINKKFRLAFLVFFIFFLTGLFINSTTTFRLKLADHYMTTQSYDNAITVYKKALRRENFKLNLRSKREFIMLQLSDTYFKSAKYHYDLADSYFKLDDIDFHFLDKAVSEYEKIAKLYEDYQKTFEATPEELNDKWAEILKKSTEKKIGICFAFGERYVKKKMWQEAKIFYTKKILKHLNPVIVLKGLDKLYNWDDQSGIREKIWGQDIFVTLEDFEDSADTVFGHWARNTEPTINAHKVSTKVSYKGNRSEYFDLSYAQGGYDYWNKSVYIPLDVQGSPLGIRVFIKSQKPFQGHLKMNVRYPKEDTSGVWQSDPKEYIGEGWEMPKIENLFEKAKSIGSQRNWDTSAMEIDNIIIDSAGVSNKFYVDNIELYLLKIN